MEWVARLGYLAAKNEVRQVELYAMDLLWGLAKPRFTTDIPMPSEYWNNRKKTDKRSGKQIMDDLLKSLGGE